MYIIFKMDNGNKEIVKKCKTPKSLITQFSNECNKIANDKGIKPEQVAGKILFCGKE